MTRWRWTPRAATRAIVAYLPEKALSRAEQRSRPHQDTSFTWDETTHCRRIYSSLPAKREANLRDLAKRFLEDDTYFNPLAEGNNVLPLSMR